MNIEIKVPSPGESITQVQLAAWLVADGDYIEKEHLIELYKYITGTIQHYNHKLIAINGVSDHIHSDCYHSSGGHMFRFQESKDSRRSHAFRGNAGIICARIIRRQRNVRRYGFQDRTHSGKMPIVRCASCTGEYRLGRST